MVTSICFTINEDSAFSALMWLLLFAAPICCNSVRIFHFLQDFILDIAKSLYIIDSIVVERLG